MPKVPIRFPIEVFAKEKFSDTLTKARLGIFYKGINRNRGYISDEFAETLLKTLPYTPVKGIYDSDKEDFTDHGTDRSLGRIYGITPKDTNFAWEKHTDKDGVEREYAVCDVLLFTSLYEEAEDIIGKPQSMELYSPSIEGNWITKDGNSVYKYTKASFLGLQVLGDDVEPCFEGSSFFTLESQQFYSLFMTLSAKIEQLTIGRTTNMGDEANKGVDTPAVGYNPLFTLSDKQKQNALFKVLNPEKVQYWIIDTYENYAILYDFETEKYQKINFTKNEDDSISIDDASKEEAFSEFVTKDEKTALDSLRSKTELGTYSAVVAEIDKNNSDLENIKVELNNKITENSTLYTDKGNLENTVSTLTEQLQEYSAYKTKIETDEKNTVINKYSQKLDKDVLESYSTRFSEFTVQTLEKELAYELVSRDKSIFTAKEGPSYVPKPENSEGLELLLTKHKKN